MSSHPYTTIDQARTMPLDEALEAYDMPKLMDYMLDGIDGDIYIFEEDAHFESMDLDALFCTDDICGAYFMGKLTVDNYITQRELDYGPFVYVQGQVRAKNIYLGGGYIHFHGNVTVEQTIVAGTYNHGQSAFDGYINAEVIISMDHSFDYQSAKILSGILLMDNEVENDQLLTPEEVVLPPYWYEEEECLETDQIREAILQGTSILAAVKIRPTLEEQLTTAAISKQADLSGLKLTTLPLALLQLKDLEQLNLSGNPIILSGDELASLTQLKHLDLSNCGLDEIPAVISKMTGLTSLDLSKNAIREVPDSFVALSGLQSLSLRGCELNTIPEVLQQLPKLEVLKIDAQGYYVYHTLDNGFSGLKELHMWGDVLVELPALEYLYLNNYRFAEVPAVIRASKQLKVLRLRDSTRIETLPEWLPELSALEEVSLFMAENMNLAPLAQLPKLTRLELDHAYSGDEAQYDQLLAMDNWSQLRLKSFMSMEVRGKIVSRPKLTSLVLMKDYWDMEIDLEKERAGIAKK